MPVMDAEFVQFHPTGLHGAGVLISEAARGEGGILLNSKGERFMGKYDKRMELAPRDVVSRGIAREIVNGNGCGPKKDHVMLRMSHLPKKVIAKRLPAIAEICKTFARLDVSKDDIPVVPTAHYTMGGIPTDINGVVPGAHGLYAAGEAACVSVHGANRLGANSLLETVVFGDQVGRHLAQTIKNDNAQEPLKASDGKESIEKVERLLASKENPMSRTVSGLRKVLQETMDKHVGVFRTGKGIDEGIGILKDVHKALPTIRLKDRGRMFNTELTEALELENMCLYSLAVAEGAKAREESRGAHHREDFPGRDDATWQKHTLATVNAKTGDVAVSYKPVDKTNLYPQEMRKISDE